MRTLELAAAQDRVDGLDVGEIDSRVVLGLQLPDRRQLRMVPIAPRDTTQDRARQQRLASERHQAMRIEMRRVDGPDSHYRYLSHQAGVRSFTRANQRLIGISTARIAAQHR